LDLLRPVVDRYDPPTKRTTVTTTAGQGKCPHGRCEDCWDAGFSRPTAAKRYRLWCRKHGDFRARYGQSMPPVVTQAAEATKAKTTDGTIDWEHWSIDWAWKQANGK